MPTYKAPLDDIRFVLEDVIDAYSLDDLPDYVGTSKEEIDIMLGAAASFCEHVLLPLNQAGDDEGCALQSGRVLTPKGFREAYDLFRKERWPGLSCKKEHGGLGLPLLFDCVFEEMASASNMAFSIYPMLSHAAYNVIEKHADEDLKNIFLPPLIEGRWTGTICMTEPRGGTDIGLIETMAEPQQSGAYRIDGMKIFVSGGDQDMSENIVHLVLARLPDAMPGIRGLSLFLVPKYLPKTGARNDVVCTRLERNMGLHALPVCRLKFSGAKGWLIGKPGKGASQIFTMVNEGRLAVGLQGLGVAEIAYQNARDYAKKRLQMRSPKGPRHPDKPADPIMAQPDVRLHLLTMKAYIEGCRALALWTAFMMDIAAKHPVDWRRKKAERFAAVMIPVVKAFTTDMGFDVANRAMQIFGGHGYVRDNGIEQFVRDVRVTQIYEGTNGIMAMELALRKATQDNGLLLRPFFQAVTDFLEEEQGNEKLKSFISAYKNAFSKLQLASLHIYTRIDPTDNAAAASDYLRLFGLVAVGFMWLKMAKAALDGLANAGKSSLFYETKLNTAAFYFHRILPKAEGLYKAVLSDSKLIMTFKPESL